MKRAIAQNSSLLGARPVPFTERVGFAMLGLSTLIVILPVAYIVGYLLLKGGEAISLEFLFTMPRHQGIEGGLLLGILGTFYLMLGTVIFALPVGVLAATYLTEYARPNPLTRTINLAIINLAGVPSIVYGMFGVGFFVIGLGLRKSLLAGSLTLACQALALVITSSREALLVVPKEYREASLALGITKWQTVWHVVLRQALPGILTGAILAMGRAAGETAPLLAVGAAFGLRRLPLSPLDPFKALSVDLFYMATQVPQMPEERKWGAAVVLIIVVLFFNLTSIILRFRLRRGRVS